MNTLRDKLATKQANLRRSLGQCDVRVLKLERELQEAREARAACQGALQVADETLADMEAAEVAEAAKPGPATAGATARNG